MHFMTDMRCVFLRKRRNIKTYTSKEIDAFKYKNIIEEPAEYGVEKF